MTQINNLYSSRFNLLSLTLALLALAGLLSLGAGVNGRAGVVESVGNYEDGVELPIAWGALGQKMVESGVVDAEAFAALYESRGGLSEDEERMLSGTYEEKMVMNEDNAHILLNLLWAFGLSNTSSVLTEGPIRDPKYGGYEGFASTGGWTIMKGSLSEHFNAHQFVRLTQEQEMLVRKVAENIYRPCCNNSTYFPDCNHGMAMLGLLELMAAHGVSEDEMYEVALAVNSYWFPDVYENINHYLSLVGTAEKVSAKELLGRTYSSGSGYQQIVARLEDRAQGAGSSCSV